MMVDNNYKFKTKQMKTIDLSQPQHTITGQILEILIYYTSELLPRNKTHCRIANGGEHNLKLTWYPELEDDIIVCLDFLKDNIKDENLYYLYKRYIMTTIVDWEQYGVLIEEIDNYSN